MKRELKDLSQFIFRSINTEDAMNLNDFFDAEADFYTKVKGKKKEVVGVFVKHSAIQRLALEAGVRMTSTMMLVQPNGSNEQQHLFGGTFTAPHVHLGTNLEGDNRWATEVQVTEVGEASTRNTSPGVSRAYMGTMAYKRLFDRGVLNVLGFNELYSEEEADELNHDFIESKMASKDFEAIGTYLNSFANATTVKELDAAMKEVVKNKDELNVAQRAYLRNVYKVNLFDIDLDMGTKPAEKAKAAEVEPSNPLAAKVAAANAALEKKAQAAEHAARVASGEEPF